jgi:hypothetical protein
MTVLHAFSEGIRKTLGSPRLLLTLYLFNLLLAFPAAYSFKVMLGAEFGSSLSPEQLLSGFDFTVFSDFMNHHGNALRAVLWQVVPLVLLGLLIGPFLTGGTLAALRDHGSGFSVRTFFRDGSLFYSRMFRLSFIFSFLVAVLLTAGSIVISGVVSAVDDGAMSEVPPIMSALGGIGILSLLIALVILASEYARISVVAGNSRRMIRAAIGSFGFVMENFPAVLALQVLFLLLFALATGAYWVIEGALPMGSGPTIVLVFVLQQVFVLWRILCRTATLGSEYLLHEDRKPEPVAFYGWDDSPAAVID